MGWQRLYPGWWRLLWLVLSLSLGGMAAEGGAAEPPARRSSELEGERAQAKRAQAEEDSLEEPRRAFPEEWLEWNVPQECPRVDYIEGRIVEWLGAPPLASHELSVSGRLRWRDAAWQVHVRVLINGRLGERSVVVQSCTDAADFVALTVALSVDPELGPRLGEDPEAPVGGWPRDEDDSRIDPVEDPAESIEPTKVQQEAVPEASRRQLAALVGAAGDFSFGALPGFRGGLVARVGLEGLLSNTRIWLGGRFLPKVEDGDAGATGPIFSALYAARVDACYLLYSGRLSLGPCLAGEFGAIEAGQTGGAIRPPGGRELWAALGAGLKAEFRLTKGVRPLIDAELLVPLARTRMLLDDGSAFYTTEVGLRIALGFCFFFGLE